MKVTIIAGILALLAATAHAQTLGYGAALAGNVADYVTTQHAIARGAVEVNPMRPDKWQVKATTTAVQLLLVYVLNRNHHPRAATVLGVLFGAQGAMLAVHNTQQGTR